MEDDKIQELRNKLTSCLIDSGQWNPDFNVASLLEVGGYQDRLNFITNYLDIHNVDVLVSGCSIGTECNVIADYGARSVVGIDIDSNLVSMYRFISKPNVIVELYDGDVVPYEPNTFGMVYSGHVIEHSASPSKYIKELLRVLKSGGHLFIEFPCRSHEIELHTGLKSYERFNPLLRFVLLIFNSINIISNDLATRKKYWEVLKTLKPISKDLVEKYLKLACNYYELISEQSPAPGYVRLIYRIHK